MEIYSYFALAFDYFNSVFFDETLPSCVFTLQRVKRVKGYFMEGRFSFGEKTVSEIALNPAYFGVLTDVQILSTLVHEMCHLNQAVLGKRNCPGYHSVSWANDMKSCGLVPSDTGKEGGKETGYHVTQYVPSSSVFLVHCRHLLEQGFSISLRDRNLDDAVARELSAGKKKIQKDSLQGRRFKYTCLCGINVWGKKGLRIYCGECNSEFKCNF